MSSTSQVSLSCQPVKILKQTNHILPLETKPTACSYFTDPVHTTLIHSLCSTVESPCGSGWHMFSFHYGLLSIRIWLMNCCQFHLSSVGYCVFGYLLLFKARDPWPTNYTICTLYKLLGHCLSLVSFWVKNSGNLLPQRHTGCKSRWLMSLY